MKRILKIFTIAAILMLPISMQNNIKAQVSVGVSFQVFYDQLSPYGRWINYPRYGYVWCPNDMYVGFHPYQSDGHWVWSEEYGWMWISDYEWGWATFHYGRWLYDPLYGWLWVPDYEWAPAWVVWRSGGGYYGWAPMSPGISIGLYFSSYTPPYNYWCFAPRQYITSPHVANYIESIQRNTTIINNTTVINNYNRKGNVYVTGPSRVEAERYTNSKIVPMYVRESGEPGRSRLRNNEISIYKPDIRKENAASVAPKRFERYNEDNRGDNSRERNAGNPNFNRGRDRTPDVKIKNENERMSERNNKRVIERNNPNENERKINRDFESRQERRMNDDRRQQQEMRRVPQPQNNPDINRYENKRQQQQHQPLYPDYRQSRGNGGQSFPTQTPPGNRGGNKKGDKKNDG